MSYTEVFAAKGERKAGWLELFYDLAVVAALIVTNDSFVDHPTLGSGVFAVLSLVALFGLWFLTSLIHNRFPVDGLPYRGLLLIQMACILLAALAINSDAVITWQDGLLSMAVALITISCLFAIARKRAGQPVPGIRVSIISPLLGAVVCLIGVTLSRDLLALIIAVVITVALAPIMFTLREHDGGVFPIHPDHLRERLGLLLLIAIGEGFIQLMAQIARSEQEIDYRFFVLVLLFNLSIAVFYFDDVYAENKVANPRLWRTTAFAHFLLIIGVAATVDEMAIFAGTPQSTWPPDSAGLFSLAIGALLVGFTLLEWITMGRLAPLDIAQGLLAAGVITYGIIEIVLNLAQTRGGVLTLAMFFIAWLLLRMSLKLRRTKSTALIR
ncbi:MAG: low temperature requirement protein A [Actinomycetota bacterium]|nr:low temperature requirement protein A [Actinomycetota bacterium]